jgi:hypothetical protein
MKGRRRAAGRTLDEFFGQVPRLSQKEIEDAYPRMWDRVALEANALLHESGYDTAQPERRRPYRLLLGFVIALATIAFAQQFVRRRPALPLPVPSEVAAPPPQTPLEPPKPPVNTAPPPLNFAVTSVKTMPPKTLMQGAGLACHGVDGVRRVVLTGTEDGEKVVNAPRGRCVGNGVFLSTLVEFAYGVQAQNILGGPEWTRTTGYMLEVAPGSFMATFGFKGLGGVAWPDESFQIEAAADDPSTATLGQLQEMLQTMLTDRFGLKFHRERREAAGFSLVVAERGHKLIPITGEYEEAVRLTRGKSTLDKLARSLSIVLHGSAVTDKTGLKGAFEYEFHALPLEPLAEPATALSLKLEEQLGLRLQAEKTVPIEVLVVDEVKKPSPN